MPKKLLPLLYAIPLLMGFSILSAQAQGMNEAKGATGEQMRMCLQQWKSNGSMGNLTSAQRLAIRLQFRTCLYQPIVPAKDAAKPSISILSPNGGETYKHDGSLITVNWQTKNVPPSHALDLIRLRSYPEGVEYTIASNVLNDGNEIIAPTNVPAGSYTLEIKTYVNGTLVTDSSDSYFKIVDVPNADTASEQVQCVFDGSLKQQDCHTATSEDDPLSFGCSSVGSCIADVKGPKGTSVTWKSSCGGYGYTTIDGASETVTFTCVDSGMPSN